MKKSGIIILVLAVVFMAFGTVNQPVVEKLTVDVANSSIKWKGYKPTGSHHGTIMLKSGSLEVAGDKLSGGAFAVEMASLKDADGSQRLEGHLRSKDFFEVEVFPTATFEITGTNSNNGQLSVNGKMTIKGVTKEISFPATLENSGDKVTLTTETFQINRADYNIKYKSKSFFNDLKEKFINDDFDLQVTIVASK